MGEIRFVGTGETHPYPYLVCKKNDSATKFHPEIIKRKKEICNRFQLKEICNRFG